MNDSTETWLHDTGITCAYDSEAIEYTDPVVMLSVVRPYLNNDSLVVFEPLMTEDEGDYLYQPLFFHAPNWDQTEEDMQSTLDAMEALRVEGALLECSLCSSSILPHETTGLLTFGSFERSTRSPDDRGYGPRFTADIKSHAVVCIACLRSLNDDVFTLWEDGVCNDNECQAGTQTRCWRAGCAGGCEEEEEE